MGDVVFTFYHTSMVHQMCGTGREVRMNFGNWYLRVVRDGTTVPTLVVSNTLSIKCIYIEYLNRSTKCHYITLWSVYDVLGVLNRIILLSFTRP
jgi:hypothetical protein